MTYEKTSDTTFDIKFKTAKPTSTMCTELVLFANTEISHIQVFFTRGTHTLHFEMSDTESQHDIAFNGLNAFVFCEDAVDSIESIWNTLKMFLGGIGTDPSKRVLGSHVPKYMEDANIRFIHDVMGVTLEERTTKIVDIDPDLIQSGDFFGVMRLDGLDQIIMYGTGAYVGHNVMAMRMEDNELYIVESQDSWYWPTAGLQRTKFADWIQLAENADFHLTWHRLRDDVRERFDTEAAIQFFNETEGMSYGYANFLYGWIDTAEDNWPPLLPIHFVPDLFSIMQRFAADTTYTFFTEALNRRLGVDGYNIQQIVEEGYNQGIKIDEVMGMTEQDGWRYYSD